MLAVVVLNWNGREDTLNCLRSIYGSDYPGEIVVYVPDNGSTDGSVEAIRERFPAARVIDNGGNLGFAGGNNPGWKQAVADGAEWVFFLNNDAAIAPDCLRIMTETVAANPQIGAACPRIYRGVPPRDGEVRDEASEPVWFENGYVDVSTFGIIGHIPAMPEERNSPWYASHLATGCAMLMRSETLLRTGGFDEDYFVYFEDVELSLRVRALGLICAVIPRASAWHRVSQSTGDEFSSTAVFYWLRNSHHLVRKHFPPGENKKRLALSYVQHVFRWLRLIDERGGPEARASGLEGVICGLAGQKGKRPSRRPSLGIRVTASLIYDSLYMGVKVAKLLKMR